MLLSYLSISSGIYTIRGKTYLDGTIFEAKLKAGTTCEIFIEVSNFFNLLFPHMNNNQL